MIEFPPAWKWFVTWSPGQIPQHFKESSSMPGPSYSMASAPASSHGSPFSHQHKQHLKSLSTNHRGSQHQHLQRRPSRTSGCSLVQHVDDFLYYDEDTPDQPPTIVETVLHQLSQPQSTERPLNHSWNVCPDEQTRRFLAQPAWMTRMQSAMREMPALEVVQEEEGETTSQPATIGLLQESMVHGLLLMATSRLLPPRVQEMQPEMQRRMTLTLG